MFIRVSTLIVYEIEFDMLHDSSIIYYIMWMRYRMYMKDFFIDPSDHHYCYRLLSGKSYLLTHSSNL